ncbi:MAG: DUF1549 and DUF1553 domain-containing protein [Planctomycetes bacterium]|nr:DUF1549 and DUF1553 domain-containing protein [Planctomycetota bacterium]
MNKLMTLTAALAVGFLACGFGVDAELVEKESDPFSALTKTIDSEIEKVWKRDGVKPAAKSSDSEFVRRVYLDTVGVPPTRTEYLSFVGSEATDKRSKLIDLLLEDPRYGEHLADLWMPILRERGNELEELGNSAGDIMAVWLATQFSENIGFDRTIREMLLAKGPISSNPASGYYGLMGFSAGVGDRAGLSLKHFGGMQIQCAQCHDHPYEAEWTEEAFAGMASFFAPIELKADFYTQPVDPSVHTRGYVPTEALRKYLKTPDLDAEAKNIIEDLIAYNKPQLFGDRSIKTKNTTVWRQMMARWLTSPKNKTASEYLVNRYWSFLFGSGILNPVDDFNSFNEASHPELLSQLAVTFSRNGYKVKHLYRAILNSRVYQLSSKAAPENAELWHFASASVRQLRPTQFFGTLFNLVEGDSMTKSFLRNVPNAYKNLRTFSYFLEEERKKGIEPENAVKFDMKLLKIYEARYEAMRPKWRLRRGYSRKYAALGQDDEMTSENGFSQSIDQALLVLNGDVARRLGGSRNGSLIYSIIRDEKDRSKRISRLYITILSREPSIEELKNASAYLAEFDEKRQQLGFEDLFFALISSTEFATNH